MTSTPLSRSERNSLVKRALVGHDEVERASAVVEPFGAVDERAALERHAAVVVSDAPVGDDAADRHRQVQIDHVASAPPAFDAREAALA